MIRSFLPNELETKQLHQFLLSTVAPRPIAFVSTIDKDRNHNLAPYSFFNCFSSNPPILIFSSNRTVAHNTTKHTLANVYETKNCVVNIVDFSIVRQMSLASVNFDKGESEFEKTGLTPIESDIVAAPRVKESIAQYECKVKEVIVLGDKGGAGNLVVCEVVKLHLADRIFNDENKIDPQLADLVGRMGRTYYCKTTGENVFSIYQSVVSQPIGFVNLPEAVKNSSILSGNDLGHLAALENLPTKKEVLTFSTAQDLTFDNEEAKHKRAKQFIAQGDYEKAMKTLLL